MNHPAGEIDSLSLRLYRNHLYIEASVFEAHLARVGSVALVREDDDLLIFPIASVEAGGFFIKQVNARGDRAIHAADFFRLHGIDDSLELIVDAQLNTSIAGFIVPDLFKKYANEVCSSKIM
jgi:hypothetical protein